MFNKVYSANCNAIHSTPNVTVTEVGNPGGGCPPPSESKLGPDTSYLEMWFSSTPAGKSKNGRDLKLNEDIFSSTSS